MPDEEVSQYLVLGGPLHGRLVSQLSDDYEPNEFMAATGSGPFRHYFVAYHNSYDRSSALGDIEASGFRPHRVENKR